MTSDIVFLLDVDNTLLDNDRVIHDLRQHLERTFGHVSAERYWALFEQLRSELGYADYLGALQLYRMDELSDAQSDPRLLEMSTFLIDYPFAERLYAGALGVIKRLQTLGTTVVLTDGDVVFQPRKVQRSGLWRAVEGRVLIYLHKERMLHPMQERFPAQHYVMVDDKLRILAAMKQGLGARLTTIFARQGHYATDPTNIANYPQADISLDCIGDLLAIDLPTLLGQKSTSRSKEELP
ncbi:HAD family hydrolase [Thiomonas sp. FB-Cd]|uniref:HAD family hydrolase n=1 Tax=Thiomonas sp. FB-Cd TaxID=1158292 RepID=UPI0004DF087F|nr:HAD family hydrolase [Thiomonas sp. FB-Cd]